MKRIVTLLSIAAGVFLVGCQAFQKPYTLSVGELGKETEGQPATITIGSPQLYARESLINDRMNEVRYLQRLLAESEDPAFRSRFGSQIDRELTNSASLVATLSASIDARVRRAEDRTDAAADRRAEIAALKDAIEKERLQQQLAALQAQPAPATEPAAADGTSTSTPGETPRDTPPTPPAPNFSALDEAKKRLDTTLATTSSPVPSADVSIDPQDQFRDVQAYRSVLRQALSAAHLDDIHDHEGHALYRLQFQVTAFPGEQPDLLGVVELDASGPTATVEDSEVTRLYRRWLRHTASRLNQVLPKRRGFYVDPAYLRLGAAGLYVLVEVQLKASCDVTRPLRRFHLPVPTEFKGARKIAIVAGRACTTVDPTSRALLSAGLIAIDTAQAESLLRN